MHKSPRKNEKGEQKRKEISLKNRGWSSKKGGGNPAGEKLG